MSVALAEVNKALHRNIKSGLQYDKYFPKAQCRPSQLGTGDTTYTLQLMKQQVLAYKEQTKLIAQKLKKSTIPENVKSLYNFSFNHFQYNADGYEQQLRSPACSWASRKLGIDCKSYSLFIGSCLLNLNIPFKFRKITQPNSPDDWSHVYVVIDYKGKELIIDATKRVNTEPEKMKQFDMPVNLPHIGLNAVATTTTLPIGRDIEMIEAIDSFNSEFIPFLQNQGIRPTLITEIKAAVKNSLLQGLEPFVKLLHNGIEINNVKYLYDKIVQGMQGLGFIDPATISAVTSIFSSGLFSNLFGKDANAHATKRIVQPMGEHIQAKLQGANEGNLHTIVTELDEHLNAYITHETFVGSKYSAVAIPKLKEFLGVLRKEFSNLKYTTKTGVNGTSFRGFWTGDANETLVHGDKKQYQYRVYSPSTSNYTSTNLGLDTTNPNPNSNTFLKRLETTVNGLLKDKQTGQLYTPQQAQQIVSAQNGGYPPKGNNSTGMSTTTKVVIGVGSAVVIGGTLLFLKSKNII